MSDMIFGVNLIPGTNNTYTLGDSQKKWNAYFYSINGSDVSAIFLPAVDANDNGKILKVVSGAWDMANAPAISCSVTGTTLVIT